MKQSGCLRFAGALACFFVFTRLGASADSISASELAALLNSRDRQVDNATISYDLTGFYMTAVPTALLGLLTATGDEVPNGVKRQEYSRRETMVVRGQEKLFASESTSGGVVKMGSLGGVEVHVDSPSDPQGRGIATFKHLGSPGSELSAEHELCVQLALGLGGSRIKSISSVDQQSSGYRVKCVFDAIGQDCDADLAFDKDLVLRRAVLSPRIKSKARILFEFESEGTVVVDSFAFAKTGKFSRQNQVLDDAGEVASSKIRYGGEVRFVDAKFLLQDEDFSAAVQVSVPRNTAVHDPDALGRTIPSVRFEDPSLPQFNSTRRWLFWANCVLVSALFVYVFYRRRSRS